MYKVLEFDEYNEHRYGDPWIAKVNNAAKIDFSQQVGGYSGLCGKGEAGFLYISEPVENQWYAWGQKDYRSKNTIIYFGIFKDGKIEEHTRSEMIESILDSED